MRTQDEIREVIKNKNLLKSDKVAASFIELFSFLPLSDLPEKFVSTLTEEARQNWDRISSVNAEVDLDADIKDELAYLRRLLNNGHISETIYRTPRVLSLVWVKGYDVSKFDRDLLNIECGNHSARDIKRRLNRLYIKLEETLQF